jgi:hypothetical protein
MADLKPYPEIPSLLPPEASAETIAANNQAFRDRMRAQVGTKVGDAPNPLVKGGPSWQYRSIPGIGDQVVMRAKPGNPDVLQFWDPQTGITEQHLGGEEYYNQMDRIRRELPQGQNPLTGQPWDPSGKKNLMNANYGDLLAWDQMNERAKNYKDVDPAAMNDLTISSQVADTLRDIEDRYKAAGGQDGLNKLKQTLNSLETSTGIQHYVQNGPDTPERTAYLGIMRDINKLAEQGVQVSRLTSGQGAGGAVADTINDVLKEGGIFHPMVAALGSGAVKGFQAIAAGNFDPDALRTLVPITRYQLDQQIGNKVASMTQPGAQTKLPETFRQMGRDAYADLYKNGIGYGDPIPQKADLIPEPSQGQTGGDTVQPNPTPSGTPEAKPTADQGAAAANKLKTAATTVAETPMEKDADNLQKAQNQAQGYIESIPAVQFTKAMTAPIDAITKPVAKGMLELGKKIFTPQEEPTDEQKAAQQKQSDFQRQLTPSATSTPTPSGTPISDNTSVQVPRLTEQNDVDQLEPGTPFYWADHPDAYVKT